MCDLANIPDFDALPPVHGMPQGCAWGIFDVNGVKDHLGCVNLLTPQIVADACNGVRDGISISLNWPIGALAKPGVNRKGLSHRVVALAQSKNDPHGFDDEVEFNTQCSSQWDSLVHFLHQPTLKAYNDSQPTIENLSQPFGMLDENHALPTLNHWHDRGGLVGRGVLLDYREYARATGIRYSPFESHAIAVSVLEDVAKYQGVEFRRGDVLMIRTGYSEDLTDASADEQSLLLGKGRAVGVKGCRESAKWFWNHHFSAVASDNLAFEVFSSYTRG